MIFINKGEPVKIRIGGLSNFHWKTVKTNEVIELTREIGKRLGFIKIKTTEGQIGNKVVETKQIELVNDTFFKELLIIKGIGKNIINDIVSWGTKEKLIEYIKADKKLPFRNDIELKLREKYGR